MSPRSPVNADVLFAVASRRQAVLISAEGIESFIQRTSPASFGAEYLLFGQVELTYYEFAGLQRIGPSCVGQVISHQFQGAILCWRKQVEAVGAVQGVFIEVLKLFPRNRNYRMILVQTTAKAPWRK